jgi:PII-like signaling protein
LRTDRLLSLSEDAPLVAVAVGDRALIEGLAVEVRGIASEGLVVLEEVGGVDTPGDRVKATIWGPRSGPTAPHLGAVEALRRHGAESATVLLGVDGILDGGRRRAKFAAANRGVPAITVAVGERTAIDAAMAAIDGAYLVTIELVVGYGRIATLSHHTDPQARVTLVTSEVASRGGHPTYLEFIRALRREGAAGATAARGVWGFRGEGEPHGDRVLGLRRDVPMVVETVDAPERAARWFELALSLANEGDVVYAQPVPKAIALA